MAHTPDTQQGATAVFTGLATFTDAATNIPEVSVEGGTVDTTHLGTTGQRTYIAQDLTDVPEFELTFQHDGSTALPAIHTSYTLTITAPLATGDASAESFAGTVLVTGLTASEFQSDSSALQTQKVKVKPDGQTDWARTAAVVTP